MGIGLYILAFVVGACVGSFLNVCIYRLPREGLSISRPKRSFCFSCKQNIAWYDNIPIFSYFLLRGRCRHCGAPYSIRYALVELLTGVCFLLVAWRFEMSIGTPIYLAFTGALIVSTFIDLDHYIIPDEISIPGIIIGFILGMTVPFFVEHAPQETAILPIWEPTFLPRTPIESLLGGLIGGGLLWSLRILAGALLRREALGFGDVKLITMIGLLLGWKLTILTIFLSALLGLVVSIPLHMIQGKGRFAHIPYGPYLALGAFLCMIFGDEIFTGYIRFGLWLSGLTESFIM